VTVKPETRLVSKFVPPQVNTEEAETVKSVADFVKGAIGATWASSFVVQILLAGSLNTIFMSSRYLQIMVHMLLVRIQIPANAYVFFAALFQVAAFDVIPTDSMYMKMFDIDEEPLSENFEHLGYETRQFLYNSGSISLVIILFFPIMLCVYLIGWMPCQSAKKVSARVKNRVLFSGIFSFLIESYMILSVCCCINQTSLKWVHEKSWRAFGVNINILFTYTFTFIVVAIPIAVGIVYKKYFDLIAFDTAVNERYGKFIAELSTLKRGKSVLYYPVMGHVRKLILAFTMIFLQNYPNFTLFSINF